MGDGRGQDWAARLADDLTDYSICYRAFADSLVHCQNCRNAYNRARDLASALYGPVGRACNLALDQGLAHDLTLSKSVNRVLERAAWFYQELAVDLIADRDHGRPAAAVARHRARALELADRLDAASIEARSFGPLTMISEAFDSAPDNGVEGRLLGWLARFLLAQEQERFVAEAQGNLGDCDRWWRRVDHLVCLALGMPRLAWMMWREGRRGRV